MAACDVGNPIKPDFKLGEGYNGCLEISKRARKRAGWTNELGWIFSAAGTGATVTGATIIPLDGELTRRERIVSASLIGGGAILVAIGQAWFKRSDAASILAGATAGALGDAKGQAPGEGSADPTSHERSVVSKCNLALSAWESSRTDATAVANSLLNRQESDEKKAQQTTQQAKESTKQAALKACEKANCTADQISAIQSGP